MAEIKTPRSMENNLLNQYGNDNHDTNELQDSCSNGEIDLDKIENLNNS